MNIPIKNNIQKLRESRGLNQEDLAEVLGVTRTYLSKLENQRFSPGPGLMQKVCLFFGKDWGKYSILPEVMEVAAETDVKVKQYIHKVSVDRKTGEKLSESYEPYVEVPEITLEEHTNKLLRATVGDVDRYVGKMLEDLKMQEGERTPQRLEHRAEGA